jgi:putative ATP-binding cassette transporter
LFRVLSRTWPLGHGRIRFPARARVLALPQRPYFPLGTLRQAVVYPRAADAVDEAELRAAMTAVGLAHLTDRLDQEAEWSTLLAAGEQQRIGFARALILQPTILLLDDAVSMLEEAEGHRLYCLLAERLPDAMLVSTGRSAALSDLHDQTLEMNGACAAPRPPQPELVPA